MGTRIPAQPDYLIQLRRTQHAVRTRLDAGLVPTGLTTPQFAVLATLEREGKLSASDLAREFGMTAQTMNVLVRSLEADGLLRRDSHPTHGRILLASLTPAGTRALQHGRALAVDVQGQMLRRLSGADRRALMRYLTSIEEAATRS
jgi:DNA-binding MarR family transcriptional regulator